MSAAGEAHVHPSAFIPLIAATGAVALASAILARDPGSRANWLAAGSMACTGWWAFCELAASLSTRPEVALVWLRAAGPALLLLGPLLLDVLREFRPDLRCRLRRPVLVAYAAGGLLGVLHAATPWVLADVQRTGAGWSPQAGPLFPPAVLVGALLPAAAAVLLAQRRPRAPGASASAPAPASRWLGRLVAATVAAAVVTDVVLPQLGWHVPRLGSLVATGAGGAAWLVALRVDSVSLTASGFAREILEALPDGVAIVRGDGTVRAANGRLAVLSGRSRRDLVGLPLSALLGDASAELDVPQPPRETWLRVAGGGLLPVAVSSSLLRDRQGYALGVVAAIRDQREVVALRRRLVTAGRLAAVGELAAGIAHEVNNPVAYIRANLGLLERDAADLADKPGDRDGRQAAAAVRELAGRCLRRLDRVTSLVREVRGFSHGGGEAPRVTDVGDLLEGALRLAAHRLREREVAWRREPAPLVRGVEQELKQLLLDVLLACADAAGEKGGLRIDSGPCGTGVRIAFERDGGGADAGDVRTSLDPLVQSSGEPSAAGLGLSTSWQIARQHGGRLEILPRPGAGAAVEVWLPAVSETRTPAPIGAADPTGGAPS